MIKDDELKKTYKCSGNISEQVTVLSPRDW